LAHRWDWRSGRFVRYLLEPFTEFFRFIPATAMITVAVIWFGIGEGSKIFLIIYTTVFIVTLNTAAGVGAIAPNKIRAARSLGASTRQVFLFVALPATAPYILTGMRLAMGNSFVTIVAAELIASNAGLGKMIWDARLYMLVDQIFVALLTLGLLGFATDTAERFIKSLCEANDLIDADRPAAAKMVAKFLSMPVSLAAELMPKLEYDMFWIDASLVAIKDSGDLLIQRGKMKAPLDYAGYVYPDLLKAVRPDAAKLTQIPSHQKRATGP
jgi:ABC-type proline/glycine betaine transport system permease subunit